MCSKIPKEMFVLLKPLNVTMKFVFNTSSRYNVRSSANDRPRSGFPCTALTPAVVKAVAERIQRNLLCKQKIVARKKKIPQIMSRIVRSDLRLRA